MKYYKYQSSKVEHPSTYFLFKVEGDTIIYQRFPKLTQFPCWQPDMISMTDLLARDDEDMVLIELTKEEMFIEVL